MLILLLFSFILYLNHSLCSWKNGQTDIWTGTESVVQIYFKHSTAKDE